MRRIKLVLAYEGTRYAGWQMQWRTKGPSPATIQGELERVFAHIAGERIVVHGAGRTDSGVHAEAQVCHADIPERCCAVSWLKALNGHLPYDIRVLDASYVAENFHSRKDATKKTYAYTVWSAPLRAVPRIERFVWSTPLLDKEKMEEAAGYIVGTKDFAVFQNSGTELESTVRTVLSITPCVGVAGTVHCPADWPVVTWLVEGDGFLRQMVRNIMGLLVWVGTGKIAPSTVPALIAAKERKKMPSPSAPAQGLTLLKVWY